MLEQERQSEVDQPADEENRRGRNGVRSSCNPRSSRRDRQSKTSPTKSRPRYDDIGEVEGETEMRDMIGYIARVLVDDADAVQVRSEWSDGRLNINLKVADADKGKVIGRRGRVVHAMQSLLRVAATKSNMRAGIETSSRPRLVVVVETASSERRA